MRATLTVFLTTESTWSWPKICSQKALIKTTDFILHPGIEMLERDVVLLG